MLRRTAAAFAAALSVVGVLGAPAAGEAVRPGGLREPEIAHRADGSGEADSGASERHAGPRAQVLEK